MKRWLPFVPLGVLLLLGGLFAGYALRKADPEVHPAALVGQPVPAIALPGLDGAPAAPVHRPGDGVTLINLFASWCAPCAVEHPELMRLKARGVRIVGIAYKDDPAKTRAFLQRLGDPFDEVRVDRDGDAGVEFGITGVPESYLVGADGVIFAKHGRPMTAAEADAIFNQLQRDR